MNILLFNQPHIDGLLGFLKITGIVNILYIYFVTCVGISIIQIARSVFIGSGNAHLTFLRNTIKKITPIYNSIQ